MYSLKPMERLPCLSTSFGEMPRKSRTRGSVTWTSFSRKCHMRAPRRVTFMPMFWPWRTLKLAIDFFASVLTGFWPVMRVSVVSTVSGILGSLRRLVDMPTLTDTNFNLGTAMRFLYPKRSISAGTIFFSYCSRNIGLFDGLLALLRHADLAAVFHDLPADAGRLAGLGVDEHDVRGVDGSEEIDLLALLPLLAGLGVLDGLVDAV